MRPQKGRRPRKRWHKGGTVASAAAEIYAAWPDLGVNAPPTGEPEPLPQGRTSMNRRYRKGG